MWYKATGIDCEANQFEKYVIIFSCWYQGCFEHRHRQDEEAVFNMSSKSLHGFFVPFGSRPERDGKVVACLGVFTIIVARVKVL